jgi:peptide/nickel transport system permease protein
MSTNGSSFSKDAAAGVADALRRAQGCGMARMVLGRVAWSVVLLFVITFCVYVIFFVVPTPVDPRRGVTGTENRTITDAFSIEEHGFVSQYTAFLDSLLHGDLGESYRSHEDVTAILGRTAPVTASLVLGAAVLWLLLAIPIGIWSALRPGSLGDRVAMIAILIGIAAHPLWLGYMLSYVFGFQMQVLPLGGYCELIPDVQDCSGPGPWAYHLLLPWLTLALGIAALYARMIRATTLEALHEEFVRTGRAKGLGEWAVVRHHVIPNALTPIVTMVAMDAALLFGSAVFVEKVYGLPGLGNLLTTSLRGRDLPVILGVTLCVSVTILLLTLVADLLYGVLDPRVRAADRRHGHAV